jgi:hypothetical protein
VRDLESIFERAVITSQVTVVNSLQAGEQEARDGKSLATLERDHILQCSRKLRGGSSGKRCSGRARTQPQHASRPDKERRHPPFIGIPAEKLRLPYCQGIIEQLGFEPLPIPIE